MKRTGVILVFAAFLLLGSWQDRAMGQEFESLPLLVGEEVFQGKAVEVQAGDRLVVERGGEEVEVRLLCLQAPPLEDPVGVRARDLLRRMVEGKRVTVRVWTHDPESGAAVSRVILDERDVALDLLREGLARHKQGHSREPEMAAAEEEARQAGRGLWASPRGVE